MVCKNLFALNLLSVRDFQVDVHRSTVAATLITIDLLKYIHRKQIRLRSGIDFPRRSIRLIPQLNY